MRRNRRNGFTLMETLVAISVLGVTLTAVAACFTTGLALRSRSLRHLSFDRDARAVLERMQDDFEHVVLGGHPPTIRSDALVLWRMPGQDSAAGPSLVTYQWAASPAGDSLLVRVESPLSANPNDRETVRAEFLDWTETFMAHDAGSAGIQREPGRTRFGDRAERNGRRGRWTGYPHVRGFAFSLVETGGAGREAGNWSRVRVAIEDATQRRVETDLWLATVAQGGAGFESTTEVLP